MPQRSNSGVIYFLHEAKEQEWNAFIAELKKPKTAKARERATNAINRKNKVDGNRETKTQWWVKTLLGTGGIGVIIVAVIALFNRSSNPPSIQNNSNGNVGVAVINAFGNSNTINNTTVINPTTTNKATNFGWLPPEMPIDCKMVSVQFGGIYRVSYEVSYIKAAPMGRVGITNLLASEIGDVFDTRFPLVKRYTNVFYGVPEWDLANNPYALKNPLTETNPIPIGFSLYLKDNRAYVDFLSVSEGRKVIIFGDRPDDIPSTWDHNFDSTTREIVDEYSRVAFRIIYINPYTIRIEAFYSQNGTYAVVGENRFGLGNLDSNEISGNSNVMILTPLFKYPSWLYPAMRN